MDSVRRNVASIRLKRTSNRWSFLYVCCCVVVNVSKSIVLEHCSNPIKYVVEFDRIKSSLSLDPREYIFKLARDEEDHFLS